MPEPNPQTFRDLVRQMRAAQKAYFLTKGGLDDCRKLEKAVDDWLANDARRNSPQKELFKA